MKRFVSVLLAVVLCFSSATPVFAAEDSSLTGIATPVVNVAPNCASEWPSWIARSDSYGKEPEFISAMTNIKAAFGSGLVSSILLFSSR